MLRARVSGWFHGDSKAAPLAVSLTTFPGLKVRAGRWCTAVFPACGCDACDETANSETIRLAEMIDDVVAGRFREGLAMPPVGEGWQEWELWSPPRRSSGRLQVDRERARAMLAGIEGSLTTVTARVCLDILRSRRLRREESLDAYRDPDDAAGLVGLQAGQL